VNTSKLGLLAPGNWYGHNWLRENFIEHTNLVGTIGLVISVVGAIIACTSRHILGFVTGNVKPRLYSIAIKDKIFTL